MKHKQYKTGAWRRQRVLKKQDIPPQEEIIRIAKTFKDPMERALFIMCYLTGGRISEIVKCNFLRKNHYAKQLITDNQGQRILRVKKDVDNNPMITKTDKIKHDYVGIQKKNIIFTEQQGKQIMVISMENRKNPNIIRKMIPIPMEKEGQFVDMLKEYINTLDDESPIFPFGTGKARKILAKIDMNPHFLRDIRLTHMVTVYGFSAYQLVKFAGWKNANPSERYVRLTMEDLVDKY